MVTMFLCWHPKNKVKVECYSFPEIDVVRWQHCWIMSCAQLKERKYLLGHCAFTKLPWFQARRAMMVYRSHRCCYSRWHSQKVIGEDGADEKSLWSYHILLDFLSTFLSGFQENNTYPYAGVNIDMLAFSISRHLCLESTMYCYCPNGSYRRFAREILKHWYIEIKCRFTVSKFKVGIVVISNYLGYNRFLFGCMSSEKGLKLECKLLITRGKKT